MTLNTASQNVRRTIRDWLTGSSSIFQGTLAATLAWIIARHVVDNHEPFFAPIAAVIALNAALGERGANALRLLLGVVVGVLVGQAAVYILGREYWSLAIAVFAAMWIAKALGGVRIVNAQAAASAILTVVVADSPGTNRLVDVLIGAGVALVFSQFLFSPEPTRLLRRAESEALLEMSKILELTARALEGDDDDLVEQAIDRLRDLRDELSELARVRHASLRTARHSVVWRRRAPRVAGESESAAHLDLLGGSCLMLTRLALAADSSERRRLVLSISELSGILGNLSEGPGDRRIRQTAAEQCLGIIRRSASDSAAETAVRMVAADTMAFAGIGVEAILKETNKGPSA